MLHKSDFDDIDEENKIKYGVVMNLTPVHRWCRRRFPLRHQNPLPFFPSFFLILIIRRTF
jgi:hypothetical protein